LINFVRINSSYCYVIDSLINPIIKHLNEYEINEYVENDCVNVHFFSEPNYVNELTVGAKSVFIPHTLGDKCWRSPRENKFDFTIASSELMKSILIKRQVVNDKIKVLGYPKTDMFFDDNYTKTKNTTPRILWCPTHTNSSASSLPHFLEYIKYIPDKYEFISHFHPYDETENKPTTIDLLSADVIIADIGSMMFEAWAVGKPVILLDWIVKDKFLRSCKDTLEGMVYLEKVGYHANNIDELLYYIDYALLNGINNEAIDFAEKVLPTNFRGNSGKLIAEFLKEFDSK